MPMLAVTAPPCACSPAVNEARTVGIRYGVRDRNNVLTYSSPRVDTTLPVATAFAIMVLGSFGNDRLRRWGIPHRRHSL